MAEFPRFSVCQYWSLQTFCMMFNSRESLLVVHTFVLVVLPWRRTGWRGAERCWQCDADLCLGVECKGHFQIENNPIFNFKKPPKQFVKIRTNCEKLKTTPWWTDRHLASTDPLGEHWLFEVNDNDRRPVSDCYGNKNIYLNQSVNVLSIIKYTFDSNTFVCTERHLHRFMIYVKTLRQQKNKQKQTEVTPSV